MKAAVLYKPKTRFVVEDVEVQEPKRGEVMVRMAAGGVCHSDLHVLKGDLEAPLPAILGHEGAGVVERVGEGVTSVKKGDHVIPLWRLSCGQCEWCLGGSPALCDAAIQIRTTGRLADGTSRFRKGPTEIKHFAGVSTFASLSVMPEQSVVKIRNDVPLEKAALVGCGVVTGVGAVVNAAKVRPGASVAVFGAGGVGLNAIQGAALVGAEKIIAVDVLANKLELAREMGATHVVNARDGDPVARVKELTGGQGVDYAFEVIGLPETMSQTVEVLRKRGVAVIVGVSRPEAAIPLKTLPLVFQERTVTGSVYGSARPRVDVPRLLDLYVAGKLKLDQLLTRTYPLEQINEAYEALERGETARSVVTFA
ncbi:MAG: Zn-dependent alcohol dehydrogenase [Candidatus Rokubacteria bacterium]|nr:Zn-dependent alcohol dehydrogenase [Candidatus Rokubacteria bacterium]